MLKTSRSAGAGTGLDEALPTRTRQAARAAGRQVLGLALCAVLVGPAMAEEAARVIVKLKSDAAVLRSSVVQAQSAGTASEPMARLGHKRGLSVQDGRAIGNHLHVALAQGVSAAQLAASLSRDPDVVYAVPDQRRHAQTVTVPPSDPLFLTGGSTYVAAGQWYMTTYDATGPYKAANNTLPAWATATGSGVRVAVVDSGVRFDHPDLANKLLTGANMISYASVSGVSGGRSTDAQDRGDWVTSADITAVNAELGGGTGCILRARSDWHGTKVAGIIGAQTDNGIGIAGMAPDAMILPVRVLGKCGGWDSDILAGMRWAAGFLVSGVAQTSTPAKVLNMSLGADGACTQPYKDVINELGASNVTVVVSAGNDNGAAVSSPANCPGVIAVAGVRHVGTKVDYSSLGQQVSLSAPAGNCVNGDPGPCLYPIETTTNSGPTTPVADSANGSRYTDGTADGRSVGTSFAAPQVSAAIAMMLQVRPTLTPAAARAVLMATARSFPTTGGTSGIGQCHLPNGVEQDECYCTTLTCGAGMLNVQAAVEMAASRPVPVISVNQESPQPGQTVVLSANGSLQGPGHSGGLVYLWTLVSDGGIVSANDWVQGQDSVSVRPSGAGQFLVRLTVSDADDSDATHATSVSQWVVVTAPVNTSSGSGGGGGGGAVDGMGLAALAGLVAFASFTSFTSRKAPRVRA